jgi:hypothetical protein
MISNREGLLSPAKSVGYSKSLSTPQPQAACYMNSMSPVTRFTYASNQLLGDLLDNPLRFPFAACAIPVGDGKGGAQDYERHQFWLSRDENPLVDSSAHNAREHLLVTPAQRPNALSILPAERHRVWLV